MLAACIAPPAPPAARPAAFEFALAALDGGTVSTTDYRGRWLLVNFWATWCGPCVDEMPYLQTLATQSPEQIAVLGINQREDTATIAAFAKELGITYPLLLNPKDATLLAYDVRGLPLTAIIAPDGTLVEVVRGPLTAATFGPWLEQVMVADEPSTSP
ncbi:MAG: TlpA family protein disulfide reductase [Caldilineaceae bacterium]